MRLVIAVGGNALLERGQPLEADLLIANSRRAGQLIAQVAEQHEVIVVHGNGPQVGLLALQADAYKKVRPYPFDLLGAETQGLIGYLLQQAISNHLAQKKVATLLTQVLVDKNDAAFTKPSKPIGPVYNAKQAEALAKSHDFCLQADGDYFRRVIASPKPQAIEEIAAIRCLLAKNFLVICGGGGGIPCIKKADGELVGVEAVIDKDLTAALLACQLQADRLIILTDVDAVYDQWNTPQARAIKQLTAKTLANYRFASGSMQPKVDAANYFVKRGGSMAIIGALQQLDAIMLGKAGSQITAH